MKHLSFILIFLLCITLVYAQSDNGVLSPAQTGSTIQTVSLSTNSFQSNTNTNTQTTTQLATQESTLGSMKDIIIEKLSAEDTSTFIVALKNTAKERITKSLYVGFYIEDELYGVAKRTTTIKSREEFTLSFILPEDKQKQLAEKLLKDDLTLSAKIDPFIKYWEDRDSKSIVLRKQNKVIVVASENQNNQKTQEQKIIPQNNKKLAATPTAAVVAASDSSVENSEKTSSN
ncbi:MAG: hypothetical protein Q7K43_01280, partial [Candidatus Woesearchaeota archaeon]|nr:hypothetical protein [Candidatus Woesearchaeota archaeon]